MVATAQAFMRNYMRTVVNPLKIVRSNVHYKKKVKDGYKAFLIAHERGLIPTPYFFEALDYAKKARRLQTASLAGKKVPKVGDPLMEAIPIYNTVERRYAGFSNVPELLWYGHNAPKFVLEGSSSNVRKPVGLRPWRQRDMFHPQNIDAWLFITLAHRITGSGASFEADHGFRNNRIIEMAMAHDTAEGMGSYLRYHPNPIFTSIGNQIPPFPPMGGREYLHKVAPELCMMMAGALIVWKTQRLDPMPIKTAVDMALRFQKALGSKQFKFVITAWVMDMAEYLPHLVDPQSDCYHGKNAIESINICFERTPGMKLQDWYDACTRLFADVTGTKPMDVEDASPGCDLVRWIENYVPKKGFEHVIEKGIFNGSSLTWPHGRQP